MSRSTYLTTKQWEKIEPHLPKLTSLGRPWQNNRSCLEGILWILRTGARWQDLPERYPSPSTCWRRLKMWTDQDIWLNIWRAFLAELNGQQGIDWNEAFLDGTFAPAKKGGVTLERPNAGRAQSLWYWQTARVFLWEYPSIRPARQRSRSRKKRSARCA